MKRFLKVSPRETQFAVRKEERTPSGPVVLTAEEEEETERVCSAGRRAPPSPPRAALPSRGHSVPTPNALPLSRQHGIHNSLPQLPLKIAGPWDTGAAPAVLNGKPSPPEGCSVPTFPSPSLLPEMWIKDGEAAAPLCA